MINYTSLYRGVFTFGRIFRIVYPCRTVDAVGLLSSNAYTHEIRNPHTSYPQLFAFYEL